MNFYRTRAAFAKILNDFKKIRNSVTIGVHVMSIAYLIYALATQTGFLAVNIALLALTSAYFVFFIIMELRANKHDLCKKIKEFYGWSKRLIRLPVLGIAVYGLAINKTDFDPLSFLITLLMIIGWLLDVLLYFIIRFVEIEKEYLLDSLHADFQTVPLVGGMLANVFPESDNAEENFRRLEPLIAKIKAEDELKKLAKKENLKQAKKDAKAQKKVEKYAKKLAKKLAKQDVENEIAVGEINDEV